MVQRIRFISNTIAAVVIPAIVLFAVDVMAIPY